MHVDQDHPAARRYPVDFFLPDVHRLFFEDKENRGVLWQRIGQFNIAAALRTRNPERENGLRPLRLRFERIGVESRGVVLDLQLMQAIAIMQHEAGTETVRAPRRQVVVDALGVCRKITARPVKLAIMAQIVNANLKAFPHQFRPKFRRNTVFTLRNEIERGTEAQRFFQAHQVADLGDAAGAFHIMGEHQRKFFPPGPAGPAFRDPARRLVDGPGIPMGKALPPRQNPPGRHAQRPREIGLEPVI